MKNKWILVLGVLLVFGFMLVACDNSSDSDDQETGPLVGTAWEMKYKDTGSYTIDQTNTYSFTGSSTGKFTRTGWWKDSNNNITNYRGSEDFEFTYIYSPELKQGVITRNDNDRESVFTISEDSQTLRFTSGAPYTRK